MREMKIKKKSKGGKRAQPIMDVMVETNKGQKGARAKRNRKGIERACKAGVMDKTGSFSKAKRVSAPAPASGLAPGFTLQL